MLLDCDVISTIELHGHRPTSAQGVAADQVRGEAVVCQSKGDNCLFDGIVDVLWFDDSRGFWIMPECGDWEVL